MFKKLFQKKAAFNPALLVEDELERFAVSLTADQIEKTVSQLNRDDRKAQAATLKTMHHSWTFIKYVRRELDELYAEFKQEDTTKKLLFVDIFTAASSYTMFYLMRHHLEYRQYAVAFPDSPIAPGEKQSDAYFQFLFEILNGIRDYCAEFTNNGPKRFSHTDFFEKYKAYADLLSTQEETSGCFMNHIVDIINAEEDGVEQNVMPLIERQILAIFSALDDWDLPAFDKVIWDHWNNSV